MNHKFHINSILYQTLYILTFISVITKVLANEKNHKVNFINFFCKFIYYMYFINIFIQHLFK